MLLRSRWLLVSVLTGFQPSGGPREGRASDGRGFSCRVRARLGFPALQDLPIHELWSRSETLSRPYLETIEPPPKAGWSDGI